MNNPELITDRGENHVALDTIIFLFIGVIFLVIEWRSSKKYAEIFEVLKGLITMKKEVNDLQQKLNELEKKIEDYSRSINVSNQAIKNTDTVVEDPKKNATSVPAGEKKKMSAPKYEEVLVLADQGYSVTEIADKLALSQDAVRMVMNTQKRKPEN